MIRVHAAGCSLVDNLYGKVDFGLNDYKRLLSHRVGDGGLTTGGLVFAGALSEFAAEPYKQLLARLVQGASPDSSNIGGPGIVPIIHAAQVNDNPDISYRFASAVGSDSNGRCFRSLMEKAGFPMDDFTESNFPTPSTDVLSDPAWGDGHGERTFINSIGAAGDYGPDELPPDFMDAEFLLFGGTGLVPSLHDSLDSLCRRGREAGAFVMVATVFDFRNEARMKGRPWPLVDDYRNIDLLGLDREEALKISGQASPEEAMAWFLERGCGAVVITRGPEDVLLDTAGDGPFKAPEKTRMPTCRYVDEVLRSIDHPRDTTGCGDNFIGGVIDSIAHQMLALPGKFNDPPGRLDLKEAVSSGIVSGAFALTCLGGVFYEEEPGEKRTALLPYKEAFRRQLEKMK